LLDFIRVGGHTRQMSERTAMRLLDDNEVGQRLRDYGIQPTLQRLQIARVLLVREQHVSADQVLEMVNAGGNRVSKATVYNTLGLFARKGILRQLNVDPNRVFYDTNNSRHHHFYNVDTGELSDIDSTKIPVEQLPEAPEGSVIDAVDVIIRVRQTPHKGSSKVSSSPCLR
jgi:Fur family iron response transcriptional regulator